MRTLLLLLSCLSVASAFFAPASMLHAVQTPQRSGVTSISMGGAMSKPTRVNLRNREYNKKYKSEMRTRIKRVRGPYRSLHIGPYRERRLRDCFPPCWASALVGTAFVAWSLIETSPVGRPR
jgi:hypothetical protein